MEGETNTNPMTAATFRTEKKNSASPNVFTPQRLMATIAAKNTPTATARGIGVSQNSSVRDAAIISRGITKRYCRP